MRFLVIVKASKDSEAGAIHSTEMLAEMGQFNEALSQSGAFLSGEGVHPTSKGARIRFDDRGKPTVADGPFPLTNDLLAGFWIIQAKSKKEAVDLMKRAPFHGGEIEIRQIFEPADFGDAFTPELREQEERVAARAARKPNG